MTTTHTTTAAGPSGGDGQLPAPGGLSARSRVEYGRDWGLFADWCAVVDLLFLPADAATVVQFLAACPAAPATLARRAAAIDNAHSMAGFDPPSRDDAVRAALGRRPITTGSGVSTEQLHEALKLLPSHGWTVGLFGRRDRALLILSAAGISTRQLAAASAADLQVAGEGVSTFTTGTSVITFHRHNDDPTVCGPCVLARWARLLRMIATTHSHCRWIDALQNSPIVTPHSRHQCVKSVVVDDSTRQMPLLPRIDQWGYLDTTPGPAGPRSLTDLSRAALQLRPARHRLVAPPAEIAQSAPPPAPAQRPAGGSAMYTKEQWQQGLRQRRLQNRHRADIEVLLQDLERRAAEILEQSSAAVLQ